MVAGRSFSERQNISNSSSEKLYCFEEVIVCVLELLLHYQCLLYTLHRCIIKSQISSVGVSESKWLTRKEVPCCYGDNCLVDG